MTTKKTVAKNPFSYYEQPQPEQNVQEDVSFLIAIKTIIIKLRGEEMNVAGNIRFYRRKNKMSQKELAEKIHVSERTITYYESSERIPNLDMINLLSKALTVHPKDLVSTISLKERLLFQEDFLYFNWDKENKTYELLKLKEVDHEEERQYVLSEVFDKIICFDMRNVNRIVEKKSQTTDKKVHEIITHKKSENAYYIVIDEQDKQYIIGVDQVLEVMCRGAFFPRKEPLSDYVNNTFTKLNILSLHLNILNARYPKESFMIIILEMKSLIDLVEKNVAAKVIESKIKYINYLFTELTEEEKELIKKEHEKDVEIHKKENYEKETLKKIEEFTIPIMDTPFLLSQLKKEVYEYEKI